MGVDFMLNPPKSDGELRREKVEADVRKERRRQDQKWGGPEHDDEHTVADWVYYIRNEANYEGYRDSPNPELAARANRHNARQRLIRIAALAIAAVESIDRVGEK